MYLSKIQLDRKSPSVQQALKDCEDMHRNIQKFFGISRTEAGVLYTFNSTDQKIDLYLMSKCKPVQDNVRLINGMTIVMSRDMTSFEDTLSEGKIMMYRLTAHPSKKVADKNTKNSKRKFLYKDEQQVQWLEEKAERNGFKILSVQLKKGNILYSTKKGMRLPYVTFYGQLMIIDVEKFRNSWKNGIGPEKAYGMGMLMVK